MTSRQPVEFTKKTSLGLERVGNEVQVASGTTLSVSNLMLDIPMGNINNQLSVNKFGRAPNGVQTTETDIWDRADAAPTQSVWVAPTAARIHTIASTSGNDVPGGTGAQQVEVYYLPDWDTAEQVETVTGDLNAGIAMSNAAVIIHRMMVVPQSTSTSSNVGIITATAAAPDSTVTAQINAGEGQTQMAIYGIPSIQSFYMTHFYATVNKAQAQAVSINFSLEVLTNPKINTVVHIIKNTRGLQSTGQSSDIWPFNPYFRIDGPAIIKVHGTANSNDVEASAGFDGILVTN